MSNPDGEKLMSGRMPSSGMELLRNDWLVRNGEPDVQFEFVDGIADLTWGHPDPTLLPSEAVSNAAVAVLSTNGWKALSYGHGGGPSVLREEVSSLLTSLGERTPAHEELIITAGNSATLDHLTALLTRPGDVVFVEEPTYFLALKIFADHPVRVVGISGDEFGPIPDDLDEKARAVTASGARCAALYTVPTHNNPTGVSMPIARRRELLETAVRHSITIIEDDVYREISFGGKATESLWSLDDRGVVARMGSFSKSLSPGIRVGYLTASPALVSQVRSCGIVDSGGGLSYLSACIVGEVLRSGEYRRNCDVAVASYAARCAALVDALVGSPLQVRRPSGGFFVWAELPAGMTADSLCAATLGAGVRCTHGSKFFASGTSTGFVRMAFSMLNPAELTTAGTAVARCAAELARRR